MENKYLRNLRLFICTNWTVFTLLIIGIPNSVSGQTSQQLYKFSPPSFGNGDEALADFLRSRITLKSKDFDFVVKGRVNIKLTLTHDGNVTDIKMLDSTNSKHFNKEIYDYLWQGRGNWRQAKIGTKPTDINIIVTAYLLPVEGDRIVYYLNANFTYMIDPLLINNYYNIGSDLASNKQYSDAIPYFDSVISFSAKDVDALFNRGICYLKTEELNKACSDWKSIQQMGKPDADKLVVKYCNN